MMGYDRSKQYGFGEMMFAQLLTSSYLSLAKAGELSISAGQRSLRDKTG